VAKYGITNFAKVNKVNNVDGVKIIIEVVSNLMNAVGPDYHQISHFLIIELGHHL